MDNKSEVVRILAQIAQEYESAHNGLSGLAHLHSKVDLFGGK